MKIYTKTGDQGKTSLADGQRLDKSDSVIGAIGSLDELNAQLGVLLASLNSVSFQSELKNIQQKVFVIGSLVAGYEEKKIPVKQRIKKSDVEILEKNIDKLELEVPPLQNFILPGGGVSAAHCHLARAICRRAERELLAVKDKIFLNKDVLIYLNRLSDFLFVLARWFAKKSGLEENIWKLNKN